MKTHSKGRRCGFWWSHSVGIRANREVQILCRASSMEPHLTGVPAPRHPALMRWLVGVEHARKKSIERDLPSETMQINGVATRPIEQARFKGGPKRPCCCVLALSDHRALASGLS